MSVRVLPKSIADKIAAGEVVERPASVVKELVENSLDAGSHRIEISLQEGGLKLVRVRDDGCGMDERDLALSFLSHATSKLATEEDLFNVRTMGFRGEALSSIAAVSQARIVSRTAESDAGWEIRAEGGQVGVAKSCGAPPGTQVEVRNLFYNVPVRRKFLKTPATEMAHVTEAVTRLALVHPDRHFVLSHNDRTVFNVPPARDRSLRVGEFFGRELADKLIPVSARFPEVEIEGCLLPPSVDRANTVMQYTYVNDRYVRDRVLMRAITEAYHGLMLSKRRPVCFLFLRVDPRDVDVNVHPSKIEIRLRHSRDVYSRLLMAMKDTLRQARLTPQVSIAIAPAHGGDERRESIERAIGDFFAGRQDAGRAPGAGGRGSAPAASQSPHRPATVTETSRQVRYGNCTQVLDTYIVEEVPDGVQLIDQHALHERILYDSMQRNLREGPLVSQRLLVPDLVELPAAEFLAVLELKEDLARFGLEVESFGESTLIVRAYPQVLGHFDGRSFFQDLLGELDGPDGTRRMQDRLEPLLKLMACRGAIKAGERLSPEQMRRLLQDRAATANPDTCPHGRPTTVLLTRQELEKQFRRT